jgi:hypothetical protein
VSLRQLSAQRRFERGRQHHHPVLPALALAHDDGTAVEVDVLDTQAQPFHQAHAGAIEQLRQQRMLGRSHLGQRGEDARDLVARKHDGQALALRRAADVTDPGHRLLQHLLIEKQQGRQGLPVGGRRDLALGREPGQERLDLRARQLGRMAQAVVVDEGTHPVHVGALSAQAVVEVADLLAHLIEQARW